MSDILQLSDSQKRLYEKIHSKLSDVLNSFYENHKDSSYSILLSGGYDSRYVLYLAEELNIPISCCYTFSLENKLSTDALLARDVCAKENVPCKIISLPTDDFEIIHIMKTLAKDYDCKTKTDFECTYPLYCVYEKIEEDVVLTGTDSDCYFGLGKKYALHYKNLEDGLTKFTYDMFNGNSNGQIYQRKLLSDKYNKISFDPFYQYEVRDVFKNTTWEELNVPYKKGPLYTPFADKFDDIKPYRSSYQCGDSGIRELCSEVLLNSNYNVNGRYKSVVGCYNEIVRRVKHDRSTSKLF